MTTLILVRHGQTDWNINRRFQGSSDIALNTQGLAEAELLANRIKEERFDAVYSSDLARAMSTAQRITTQDITAEPRLREIGFGLWEGLTIQEIKEQYPEEFAAWRRQEAGPPEGETIHQVAERVKTFIAHLRRHHSHDRVLVVSHGGTIGVLICLLLGLSPEQVWLFRLNNTSISEVGIYEFGNVLLRLNDTCHLIEE